MKKETKTITAKSMVQFILEQDPEKVVNMYENCFDESCGCIGVQYGRENFSKEKLLTCGLHDINGDDSYYVLEGDYEFISFIPCKKWNEVRVYKYKELQDYVRVKFPELIPNNDR